MPRALALLAVVAAVSAAPPADGAAPSGNRVTYEQYLNMPEWQQENLTKRNVKNLLSGIRQVLISRCKVVSNLEPKDVLVAAIRMDDFYHAFASIFKGRFIINAQPELFVMKDGESMSAMVGQWSTGQVRLPSWAAGAFVTAPGPRFALFASMAEGEHRMYKTLFHEGTHHLMAFYLDSSQPLWFAEGIATNFENWDPRWNVERNIYSFLGESDLALLAYAMVSDTQRRLPKPNLDSLLASDSGERSRNPGIYYAQAFAFMNFLLTSGTSGHQNINTIITGLRQRESVWATGYTLQTLSSNWKKHLSNYLVPHVEFTRLIKAYLACDLEKVEEIRNLIQGTAESIEERIQREIAGSRKPPVPQTAGEAEEAKEADKTEETEKPDEALEPELALTPEEGEARAREVLAEGLARFPRHSELLYYKAHFMLKDGNAQDAARLLLTLEKELPRHPMLFRLTGMAFLAQGDLYRARTFLRKAAAEDPTDVEVKQIMRR